MNDADNGFETVHTRVDPKALAGLDRIAVRLRLYATTVALVGTFVGAGVSAIVVYATRSVRTEVSTLRAEVNQYVGLSNTRAVRDSVRFERIIEVVELAVIAIVEPQGSPARVQALDALKARRHIAPR